MVRQIIKIDKEKCVGCGLCVNACHEGAIGLVDGKATLLKDDYCDGLGNCLPVCPTKAITFEQREANPYNKEIAPKRVKAKQSEGSCSSSNPMMFQTQNNNCDKNDSSCLQSNLKQWPIQIKLVPSNATYFDDANLLISADCCGYAYANFNKDFMKNKITIIGCPKLDEIDYSEKLTEILIQNNIKSITIARMEVPCCVGIENSVKNALRNSGKLIPWQINVISRTGNLIEQ